MRQCLADWTTFHLSSVKERFSCLCIGHAPIFRQDKNMQKHISNLMESNGKYLPIRFESAFHQYYCWWKKYVSNSEKNGIHSQETIIFILDPFFEAGSSGNRGGFRPFRLRFLGEAMNQNLTIRSRRLNRNWAMQKTMVVSGFSGIILPSWVGIIINHYQDPY